jgi:hypothetical protein
MTPSHRGIGWDWQVKNVPANPDEQLPRWKFVGKHLGKMAVHYGRSTVMLVIMATATTLEGQLRLNLGHEMSWGTHATLNAITGWAGALWICDRLGSFYSSLAAVSVALGICETWQWPPLIGNLEDAWSVGQAWGVVYHQTMRRVSVSRFLLLL